MTLYSIQTKELYDTLLSEGVAYCDRDSWCSKEYDFAYSWMVEQMKARIGTPPKEGINPFWAWYQYNCKKDPRPPLSEMSEYNDDPVMLVLDVPDNEVLLSDFMLWHHVLNKFDICSKNALLLRKIKRLEQAAGKNLFYDDLSEDIQQEIRDTWTKIFDLHVQDPYYMGKAKRNRAIQATFWRIKKEWIKEVLTP